MLSTREFSNVHWLHVLSSHHHNMCFATMEFAVSIEPTIYYKKINSMERDESREIENNCHTQKRRSILLYAV
jgi:hypothetical protein